MGRQDLRFTCLVQGLACGLKGFCLLFVVTVICRICFHIDVFMGVLNESALQVFIRLNVKIFRIKYIF